MVNKEQWLLNMPRKYSNDMFDDVIIMIHYVNGWFLDFSWCQSLWIWRATGTNLLCWKILITLILHNKLKEIKYNKINNGLIYWLSLIAITGDYTGEINLGQRKPSFRKTFTVFISSFFFQSLMWTFASRLADGRVCKTSLTSQGQSSERNLPGTIVPWRDIFVKWLTWPKKNFRNFQKRFTP